MALGNSLTCVDPNISLDQLLNSILYKASSAPGAISGLLTTIVDVNSGDIVKHPACGGPPLPALQIIRMGFGIDGDGDTTLVLIVKS